MSLDYFVHQLEELLKEENVVTNFLGSVERKTKVKRVHIVLGAMGVFSLFMILNSFAALICNIVGFAYPAWRSIKALESANKEDDNKWLTYWVVFALYSLVDFWSDCVFRYFPFYWLLKITFLVWCFLPIENNGSVQVYTRVIRPVFLRHAGELAKDDKKE